MKILMIANRHKPAFGGSEEVQRSLQHIFESLGHSVTVATTDFKFPHGNEKLLEDYPGVMKFKSSRIVKDPLTFSIPMYRWLIKHSKDFDLIWCFTYGYHTSIAPILMKRLGLIKTPIIFQPHYGPNMSLPAILVNLFDLTLGRFTVSGSDRIALLTSKYIKTFEKFGAQRKNIFIVPPVVPMMNEVSSETIVALKTKYNIPEGKRYLISVGRVVEYKGIQYTLKALDKLRKVNPNLFDKYHFVIAGKGDYLKDLRDLQKYLNLNDKVTIIENLSDEDREVVYNIGDIFTFLSYSGESFGLVIVEAMSAGCPAIASDKGATDAVVENNITGRIIQYDDSIAFIDALVDIDSNYDLYSKNARINASKYSTESVKNEVKVLLDSFSLK